MRVMVMVKASNESEAGVLPSEQMLLEMGNYNEELAKAGVMVDGAGLHPSSKGKRVRFSSGAPMITDGPFAETRELLAGYWLWEVDSMDQAVEWLKRAPFSDGEVEIRPLFEEKDFADAYTDEVREQQERIRTETSRQHPA